MQWIVNRIKQFILGVVIIIGVILSIKFGGDLLSGMMTDAQTYGQERLNTVIER